jgi:hypothetical protein
MFEWISVTLLRLKAKALEEKLVLAVGAVRGLAWDRLAAIGAPNVL